MASLILPPTTKPLVENTTTKNGDELDLCTRERNKINNFIDRGVADAGLKLQADAYIREFPEAKHRTPGPCRKYNCHGMTFAARRTRIESSSEVTKILSDDNYKQIDVRDVLAGDIVIYISALSSGAEVAHSGIVVHPGTGGFPQPIIVSKWGSCQEFVHLVYDTPYRNMKVEYYRVMP